MKKLLSIITAAAILAAAAPVVFAADADYEKLIPDVKNRLDIPEEYSEFKYISSSGILNDEFYSFSWSKKEGYGSIHADVYPNGDIVYYYNSSIEVSDYDYLSADESTKAKAEEYVKILLPSLKSDIRLEAREYQYGPIDYDVYISSNGIEYANSIGYISVKSDGTLDSESLHPVELPKEDISSFISAEDAYAKYMAQLCPKTEYHSYYDDEDRLIAFPVYSISSSKLISAATGEVTEIERSISNLARNTEAAADTGAAAKEAYYELNESERQEIERINRFISKEKLIKTVEDKLGIKFNDDVKSSLNADRLGGYYRFYYYDWENYENHFDIVIDAKTGDIMGAYMSREESNKFDEYDFSDTESMKKLIKDLAPKSAGDYELVTEESDLFDESTEGASFVYKVNGIEVRDAAAYAMKSEDEYMLSIAPLEIYKSAEYASPDTFIGAEKAFGPSDIQLRYTNTKNGIEAVYMPVNYTDINAVTGKRVNYRNEEPKTRTRYTYSDIDNHWIRPAAEKLALAGIGFEGGELKPDEGVTESLAAEILSGWRYYRGNEKYDEEKLVTRREAASMIAKRLGYEKILGTDIFKVPYSDTTEDYGAIAILKGLKIVSASAETFRPDDILTRAELVQMIYNAILSE